MERRRVLNAGRAASDAVVPKRVEHVEVDAHTRHSRCSSQSVLCPKGDAVQTPQVDHSCSMLAAVDAAAIA